MSPKVEVVLKNVTSTQGEGPHWEGDTQTLVFVDIMAGDVLKYHPGTGQQSKVHVGAPVGFAVPRKKGGYVIAAGRSLSLLDWDKQDVTSLGEVDVGSGNRINDGKCDARGRLWAGTMGPPVEPASTRPNYIPKRGSLYSLDLGGKITQKIKEVTLSNGLTWSENNKTMFYIDSPTRRVDMFDFDLETGDLANRRVCVDFDTFPEFRGSPTPFPDGMTADNQGKLWVACYFGSCVARFDPETGSMLQTVEIPNAERVTSVCWGGSNLDQLYVTTSRRGVTDEEFATTQGLAGQKEIRHQTSSISTSGPFTKGPMCQRSLGQSGGGHYTGPSTIRQESPDDEWLSFKSFCIEKHQDPTSASPQFLAVFLLFLRPKRRLKGSTITTYLVALNSVLAIPEDRKMTKIPGLPEALLRTFRLEDQKAKFIPLALDLNVVLTCLRYAPLETLLSASFYKLMKKTIFLLALATAARISEIHAQDATRVCSSRKRTEHKIRTVASIMALHSN